MSIYLQSQPELRIINATLFQNNSIQRYYTTILNSTKSSIKALIIILDKRRGKRK